jgi:hypothetical protein
MKKNHILLLSLGIVVLVSLFYWLQIRPENIRKQCSYEASYKSKGGYLEGIKTKAEIAQEPALLNSYYAQCLHDNGLAN